MTFYDDKKRFSVMVEKLIEASGRNGIDQNMLMYQTQKNFGFSFSQLKELLELLESIEKIERIEGDYWRVKNPKPRKPLPKSGTKKTTKK